MKKILLCFMALFLLSACSSTESSNPQNKKIEYEEENLKLDEELKYAYYTSDFIAFDKENEEVLKKIGVNIVDASLQNELYHDFNYNDENFIYEPYFLLTNKGDFQEILVNFIGSTNSGFFRIRYGLDSRHENTYSVYYYLFDGVLFSSDLKNGNEVILVMADGDSVSSISYIRQDDYLIEKEEN